MKLHLRKILWLLVLISLAGMIPGFLIRISNESLNNAVITTVDYREFKKAADYANEDIDKVMEKLQEKGISWVTVKEVTLRDLEYAGKVNLVQFADFAAKMQAYAPQKWAEIAPKLEGKKISPVNMVAETFDEDTAAFLRKNLSMRFTGSELITFEAAGGSYFIINTQIDPPVDTKFESRDRDTRVGFDTGLIAHLRSMGFNIILSPGNTTGSGTRYFTEYGRIIKKYGIDYLVFDGQEVSGNPDNLDLMAELVEDNNLLVGIIETSVQLGYIEQGGLDKLIAETGYPVNRVYSTRNDEYLGDADERYYRWIRAVVDRGIRIMHVVPFQYYKNTHSENLSKTIDTVGRFHSTIQDKGFVIDKPLSRLSNRVPGSYHRFMVCISLLFAGVLYLIYLARPGKRFAWALLILGLLAAVVLNLFIKMDLTKVYALGAAALYPALSSIILLIYLRDNRDKKFIIQLTASLAIILGVNALGMYTIASSMADIRYIMNIEYFRGVKVAFILPLLLFALNYFSVFAGEEGFIRHAMRYLKMKPSYLVLIVLGIASMGLYLYIARSGHTSGVTVSQLEIRVREILESIFLARPRFKEIIIGYPSLFTMVYLYRKYKADIITLVLGLGVMIGNISMVNSFSHSFTAVNISASRTLSGLLAGSAVASAVLVCVFILDHLYSFYIAPHLNRN